MYVLLYKHDQVCIQLSKCLARDLKEDKQCIKSVLFNVHKYVNLSVQVFSCSNLDTMGLSLP